LLKHVLCSNESWIDESSVVLKWKLDMTVISAYVGLQYNWSTGWICLGVGEMSLYQLSRKVLKLGWPARGPYAACGAIILWTADHHWERRLPDFRSNEIEFSPFGGLYLFEEVRETNVLQIDIPGIV